MEQVVIIQDPFDEGVHYVVHRTPEMSVWFRVRGDEHEFVPCVPDPTRARFA